MEGSIVAMEKKICPACGKEYETGNLIMSQKLKQIFNEKYITTGFEPCEECKNLAIKNNSVWFCELIKNKDSIEARRSFLIKNKVLENDEKSKKFAEEHHWIAIDSDVATYFEKINGEDNGKN